MGPLLYMRSVTDRNVIIRCITVVYCVRCHGPHPDKTEKTFCMCVCVCWGGGVVTQWYCSEVEGHVVHSH